MEAAFRELIAEACRAVVKVLAAGGGTGEEG